MNQYEINDSLNHNANVTIIWTWNLRAATLKSIQGYDRDDEYTNECHEMLDALELEQLELYEMLAEIERRNE